MLTTLTSIFFNYNYVCAKVREEVGIKVLVLLTFVHFLRILQVIIYIIPIFIKRLIIILCYGKLSFLPLYVMQYYVLNIINLLSLEEYIFFIHLCVQTPFVYSYSDKLLINAVKYRLNYDHKQLKKY